MQDTFRTHVLISTLLVASVLLLSQASLLETVVVVIAKRSINLTKDHFKAFADTWRNLTTDDIEAVSPDADSNASIQIWDAAGTVQTVPQNTNFLDFFRKHYERYKSYRDSRNEAISNSFLAELMDSVSGYGVAALIPVIFTYVISPPSRLAIFPFDIVFVLIGYGFRYLDYIIGSFFITALFQLCFATLIQRIRVSIITELEIDPNGRIASYLDSALSPVADIIIMFVSINTLQLIRFILFWFCKRAFINIAVLGAIAIYQAFRKWHTSSPSPLPSSLLRDKSIEIPLLEIPNSNPDPLRSGAVYTLNSPTTPLDMQIQPDSPGLGPANKTKMSADVIEEDVKLYDSSSWQMCKFSILATTAASGLIALFLI